MPETENPQIAAAADTDKFMDSFIGNIKSRMDQCPGQACERIRFMR